MDRSTFVRRVEAAQGTLYRVSCGMLRDEHDRRDAVQEAVFKAWRGVDRLRDEALFETWLTRILINECNNILRAKRRTVPVAEPPEASVPTGADRQLHDAVMALERDLRIVVVLHYMEGYRTREIAGILKLPEGTIKTRLNRARRELKRMLTEGGR